MPDSPLGSPDPPEWQAASLRQPVSPPSRIQMQDLGLWLSHHEL